MAEVDCKNAKITNRNAITREVTLQLNAMEYNIFLLMGHKFKADFCRCRLGPPYKPKSTGKYSQNNHFWGHCEIIAKETGNHKRMVSEKILEIAVDIYDYPAAEDENGNIKRNLWGEICGKPISEASSADINKAIEACHYFADTWEPPIILKEE